MNILLTRERDKNSALAQRLRTGGHRVFTSPLLKIEGLTQNMADRPDKAPVQGVIFTSVNGVRYAPKKAVSIETPAFCVGARTSLAARKDGWKTVHNADGNARDLARLIAKECNPAAGPLLHYCGKSRKAELAEALKQAGFPLLERVVYTASLAPSFNEEALCVLRRGEMDLALLYSPRSAAQFRTLAIRDLSEDVRAGLTLGVLSPAVAEAAGSSWRTIVIADKPNESSLLKQLDRHYDGALLEGGK